MPANLISNETSNLNIPNGKKSAEDFKFVNLIGEGSFSMVFFAIGIHCKKEYAIKICEKKYILREKKAKAIKREKDIMDILNKHQSPFFIKLSYTFQDSIRLFFVMSYAKRGELLPYINKLGCFDEECTRFYSAEILLALEHLHKLGIIHRDLKPENILLDEKMHIKVSDFGSSFMGSWEEIKPLSCREMEAQEGIERQDNIKTDSRRNSFVGTAQYVSPEMLKYKKSSISSDLWALGCIIYQMTAGLPPFRAPTEFLIFQKILLLDYEFPDGFDEKTITLVQDILKFDPIHRLGATDNYCEGLYKSIRSHPFFDPLENRWSNLHNETPPPLLPYLPCTSRNEELRSKYQVPDNIDPGLDEKQMTRLLGLSLNDDNYKNEASKSIIDICSSEMELRLAQQEKNNQWHSFAQGNLILKQGLLDKRKGLFAKRRMLLLTTGPHLYYIDPVNMQYKGEIPFSSELRSEPKNFKIFFVHTPSRTYYLEAPQRDAHEWCKIINEVMVSTYYADSNKSVN